MTKHLAWKFFFAWYDGWVGYYYDRKKHILYLILCPMIVLKLNWEIDKP